MRADKSERPGCAGFIRHKFSNWLSRTRAYRLGQISVQFNTKGESMSFQNTGGEPQSRWGKMSRWLLVAGFVFFQLGGTCAWAEVLAFSRIEKLGAYKEMAAKEQLKVRDFYEQLVVSAKANPQQEDGVKHVIGNYVMLLKSLGYNPESTILKAEKYLNQTIAALRAHGFDEKFASQMEAYRDDTLARDKYSKELVSFSPEEKQSRISEMQKIIAENNKRTAENNKEIEALKQILKNLQEVKAAMGGTTNPK